MSLSLKHRLFFYVPLLTLSGIILFILNYWSYAPFSSHDMRMAYYHGCNIGLHSPLTAESIARCTNLADGFKETLDDIDKQMEEHETKKVSH